METITIRDFYLREAVFTKEQLEQALEEFNKPEFDYPICCKSKIEGDDTVVLFSSESEGINLLKQSKSATYITPHTDSDVWEEIPYDKDRGFYHKQPVYCWQDVDTHSVAIRFYDAENKEYIFAFNGSRLYGKYDNYSATMPEHMKEFRED